MSQFYIARLGTTQRVIEPDPGQDLVAATAFVFASTGLELDLDETLHLEIIGPFSHADAPTRSMTIKLESYLR